MAIVFQFYVVSNQEARATLERIIEIMAVREVTWEVQPDGVQAQVGNLQLWAAPLEVRYQTFIADQLGVSPTLSIGFRFRESAERETLEQQILDAALIFLGQEATDGVLAIEDDVLVVQRAGSLVLNSASRFWTPERLKIVPSPYGTGVLPSL